MKNKYAGIVVLNLQGKEEKFDDVVTSIGQDIEKEGATLEQINRMGRREFAYNARHLAHGFYVNYQFEADPSVIEKVRSKLALNDIVHLQYYQKQS